MTEKRMYVEHSTNPDEIPPVHVLVAAQERDRKETEDLLAGFDRPGRGPSKPPAERDFVDYFAKKKSERGAASDRRGSSGRIRIEGATTKRVKRDNVSTVIVERNRGEMPGWVAWAGVVALMLLLGGGVAFVATKDDVREVRGGAGAATTITSAIPPSGAQSRRDDIPPPPPKTEVAEGAEPPPGTTAAPATATPTVVTAQPSVSSASAARRGDGRRDDQGTSGAAGAGGAGTGAAGAAGTTATGGATKPPPRDDFIRDL